MGGLKYLTPNPAGTYKQIRICGCISGHTINFTFWIFSFHFRTSFLHGIIPGGIRIVIVDFSISEQISA